MKNFAKNGLKFAILAVAFVLGGCFYSSTNAGVASQDKSQLLLVSAEEMDAAATESYNKVIAQAKSKKILNKNATQTKRVQTIAKNLINQVGVFRTDALSWDWQVNVITENTVNAWCMPGGKIVVYTGIIEKLNLTDAELAAVIGHEIAHALREHSRENASIDLAKNAAIQIGGKLLGASDLAMGVANIASQYTITLPFSRSNETDADVMGTELMARAGYDPNAAVRVWEKMEKLSEGSSLEILSTHPSHESRIAELKEVAVKVAPLYEEAKKSAKTTKKSAKSTKK